MLFCACAGMIPGPMLEGALTDRSCILWQRKHGGGSGACLLFDTAMLRYSTYGVAASFSFLEFVLSFPILYLISKMTFDPNTHHQVIVQEVKDTEMGQIDPEKNQMLKKSNV